MVIDSHEHIMFPTKAQLEKWMLQAWIGQSFSAPHRIQKKRVI